MAAKLGFTTYTMIFEHKLRKLALAAEASEAILYRFKIEKKLSRTAKAEEKKKSRVFC